MLYAMAAATLVLVTPTRTAEMRTTFELVGDHVGARLPECFYAPGGCGNRPYYVIPEDPRRYQAPPREDAPPRGRSRPYYRPEYERGMPRKEYERYEYR